jgi:hypothetical protein
LVGLLDLTGTLAIDAAAILLAALGLSPLFANFIHVSSELAWGADLGSVIRVSPRTVFLARSESFSSRASLSSHSAFLKAGHRIKTSFQAPKKGGSRD